MFAIIAALWSLYAIWNALCNFGWAEYRVVAYKASWFTSFTGWVIGSLMVWLVPIGLLKFFIHLFS